MTFNTKTFIDIYIHRLTDTRIPEVGIANNPVARARASTACTALQIQIWEFTKICESKILSRETPPASNKDEIRPAEPGEERSV